MASNADDAVDSDLERLLAEPWKPESYLLPDDESEALAEPDLIEPLSPEGTQPLSKLFETNLNAIHHDLMLVKGTRKNILEAAPSLDDEDNLSKFMTYEDPADHLKTVDTANLINAKEITTDLDRLLHFKQRHSLDLGISAETDVIHNAPPIIHNVPLDIHDATPIVNSHPDEEDRQQEDSGCEDEIDKLINMMPDVIAIEPVDAQMDDHSNGTEDDNPNVLRRSSSYEYDDSADANGGTVSEDLFTWNIKPKDIDECKFPAVPDELPSDNIANTPDHSDGINEVVQQETGTCDDAENVAAMSPALPPHGTVENAGTHAHNEAGSSDEARILLQVDCISKIEEDGGETEAVLCSPTEDYNTQQQLIDSLSAVSQPTVVAENDDCFAEPSSSSESVSAVEDVSASNPTVMVTDVDPSVTEEEGRHESVTALSTDAEHPVAASEAQFPGQNDADGDGSLTFADDVNRVRAVSGTSTQSWTAASEGSFSSVNSDIPYDASATMDIPMSVAPPSFAEAALPGAARDLGYVAPVWVADADVLECRTCQGKFNVVRRRHHCRACGQIFCKNCCSMKFTLPHLQFKAARVCQSCYEILSRDPRTGQDRSATNPPSRGSPPPDYSEAADGSHSAFPGPPPPLDRFGQPAYPPPRNLEGLPNAANNLPQPNYDRALGPEASIANIMPRRVPSPEYTALGRPRQSRLRTESEMSAVIMFNSSRTNLPPIMKNVDGVLKIVNNPEIAALVVQMQDPHEAPVVFLVNKNLIVKVKIVDLECCLKKKCWSFSTDGMGASNQEEIAFAMEYTDDDAVMLKKILQKINAIFERAKQGEPVSELSYMTFDPTMCLEPSLTSLLFFKRTTQCIENLLLPQSPHLFALLLHKNEIPWARNFPLRLLLRYGAQMSCCPAPLVNVLHREPFYAEIGRTIIELLADFRNFQYTLPRIPGVIIMMKSKDLTLKLPQGRYDEIVKAFSMEDNIVSLAGSFSTRCDAFLICNQVDGSYKTQVLSMNSQNKKVTGACFIIFSAALKVEEGQPQAKANVVEDGIMVQVTSDLMEKIRTSIKESNDIKVPCSKRYSEEIGKLKIQWTTSDSTESARPCSPIDGTPFSSLTNMKIRHSYDYTTNSLLAKIHWMEVYFLPNDSDTLRRLSARELGQLTSSVAKACMSALSPHLSTLIALEMSKIGLRVNLDSEVVEYKIGSNQQGLPAELSGDLDDKLIPAIHSVITTLPQGRVAVELVFHVVQIV